MGGVLVAGPLSVGMAIFSLNIARNAHADVSQLFISSDKIINALAAYLLIFYCCFCRDLIIYYPGDHCRSGIQSNLYAHGR